jgi:type IV secretory pathway TraG/TraD family ATPase VirD4
VVTSVKNDVECTTRAWRELSGEVSVVNPADDKGATWNPLEGVVGLRHALAVASELVIRGSNSSAESEFWGTLATRLLGALFINTLHHGGDIFDVVRTIDTRRLDCALDGEGYDILSGMLSMDPKTYESVLATASAMLAPWTIPQPLAAVRSVVSGSNTLYLCAPRGDHRRYEGLFRGAVKAVVDEQERRAARGDALNLLIVLDEAASIAPIEDLDQMAATLSAARVTLVSVFQDASQIHARWGASAATLINNHAGRVVMNGSLDSHITTALPELVKNGDTGALRQGRGGWGKLIMLNRPITTVYPRPWFKSSALRRRAGQGRFTR